MAHALNSYDIKKKKKQKDFHDRFPDWKLHKVVNVEV